MQHDIVIVGAGPVGLMLACELRLAGAEVVVLDGRPGPEAHAPGVAVNPGVIELLEMRGLMEACRPDGFEFPMAHFAHIWLDPSALADRYPYNFSLPHGRLVHHLVERARTLGADLRFGHRVVGVEQDEYRVETRVEGPAGGQTLLSRHLVGCDGVDSVVRRAAGIAFPGHEEPFHGTVSDFSVTTDSVLRQHLGAREYPAGLLAVSPLGPDTVRVLTAEFGVEPPEGDAAPELAEIQGAVSRLAGVGFADGPPLWSARWSNATRLAERYRAGRVFLAGDAAHRHFPLGGQALSTGLDDAVNLGWKLAADLAGRAPEGLLDSYHDERHPVGARACLTTRAQAALLHPLTPLREVFAELVRFPDVNEYLVTLVGGTDTRYQLGQAGPDADPLLGRRLPGVAAAARAVPGLASAWEAGRAVLLDLRAGGGDAGTDLAGELAGREGLVDFVTAKPLPGVDAEAVLLRPDGRIAWTLPADGDSTGLAAALAALFGEPAA
ncbi:FAD-dependent monooxygenase [Kitasatospora sp. NPDC028055]|uniref:FAD-dependent monooxygenase n=1 Tax=Kitasatospora sp. NPDC028055 TaxID=3155653 RepID=UPI0033D642D2